MIPENQQPNPHSAASPSDRIPRGGGGVIGIWYRAGRILMTRRAATIPHLQPLVFSRRRHGGRRGRDHRPPARMA